MHILIYSYNYFPEPIGIAPLMTELAEGLAKRGHQVRVVTAFPWYPVSESFPEYDRRRLYLTEYRNGVFIQRCYVRKSRRRNLLNRGIFELSFMLSSFLQAIRRGRPDVILLTVPGLPVGVPASIAGWLFRCPVILNLQDILPDAAIHVGLLTNKVAIRIFSALEKYNYRIATKIAVISEGFIDNLQEKGVPLAKMQLIPNWVDVNFIQPVPKEHNFFREKFNLQGKFIILYAGNMGLTQPMDKVVKAAKLLEQIPDIHFVFVGPESGLEQIQAWRDYTQANNITTA
jgi:colanic acid biosynthesis glycosyl transferase WcaI